MAKIRYLLFAVITLVSYSSLAADFTHKIKRDLVDITVPAKADGSLLSLEEVSAAIVSACQRRDWTADVRGPNLIRAALSIREHFVEIDIAFTQTHYSISYRSSRKMEYDEKTNEIHVKYNTWIEMLSKDIQNQLILKLLAH